MTNELIPLADIEKMAKHLVASKLFGVKTDSEAVALMLLSQAEGMHPARAVQLYHIIQGRPSMKSEAMLARFQAAGGAVKWEVSTEGEARASFSHPAGGALTVSWTLERAKKIGLAGKDNWKNYAPAMLRARVISEGVRAVFPGCILGIYATEELDDIEPPKAVVEITGKGVDALTQKVAALTAPVVVESDDPAQTGEAGFISVDKAKALVDAMKAQDIHGAKQVMQFVADNLEGRVVAKLTDLTTAEAARLFKLLEVEEPA